MWIYLSDLWLYVSHCDYLLRCDFISHICNFISHSVTLFVAFATLCDWSYLWLNILWCDFIPSICDFTLHRVALYNDVTWRICDFDIIISHYHIMTFMALFPIFAVLHLIMWLLYISQCDYLSCYFTFHNVTLFLAFQLYITQCDLFVSQNDFIFHICDYIS